MSSACYEHRGHIAAYVLGQLEITDRVALFAHLECCRDCRDDISELVPVAQSLGLALLYGSSSPDSLAPGDFGPVM